MKQFSRGIVALLLAALPASAGAITYVCDPSLPSAECSTLTTTVAGQYATYFTNANATIYVTQTTLVGDVANNTQIYNTVNYASYYAALKASETSNGITDANDVTAVNSLGTCAGFGCANPVSGSSTVSLTGPLEAALELGTPTGICFLTSIGCTNNEGDSTFGSCTPGNSSCYNDVIDVGTLAVLNPNSSQYDFVTAVEHETDEALGTSSCLNLNPRTSAPQDGCGVDVSAADLFRYSGRNTRSFLGANGSQAKSPAIAYFSINAGMTDLANYNNTNNGDDYGDFGIAPNYTVAPCAHVQDALGCQGRAGMTIANDGGVELAMLDAVGYTMTPEPSSTAMFLGGVLAIVWIGRRRTRAA